MNFDKLTKMLYQENISWIYSIIKEFDAKNIAPKEKFLNDPYVFNNMIVLGYYFMNLYVVSNLNDYSKTEGANIMNAVINGASSYNEYKLSKIYNRDLDIKELVEQYNTLVRKTKMYAEADGLKARVVAIDEVYRRIYSKFNKRHFSVFLKTFMASFDEYEDRVKKIIKDNLKDTIYG